MGAVDRAVAGFQADSVAVGFQVGLAAEIEGVEPLAEQPLGTLAETLADVGADNYGHA